MRKAVPVEQRVALTGFYRLMLTTVQLDMFGISKSTMCIVTKEVCAAIVDKLLPKYIRIPGDEGLRGVVDGFKSKLGFPQCAGAVDGTHIPIMSPEDFPADYYNRKG